ncbi:MAG: hypothetical protein ACKOAG_13120, partial [Candidatus Kapaibacterium sp.]
VLMFLCIAWSDVLGSVSGVYFSTRDAIVPAVCISGLSLFAFAARARRQAVIRASFIAAFATVAALEVRHRDGTQSAGIDESSSGLRIQPFSARTLVIGMADGSDVTTQTFAIRLNAARRFLKTCGDTVVLRCEDGPELRRALRSFDAMTVLAIGEP